MTHKGKPVNTIKTVHAGTRNQAESTVVSVRISGKEVQVGCAQGEEDQVIKAAKIVDQVMAELRQRNASSTTEKVAILTAINFAHELNKYAGQTLSEPETSNRLATINAQLDEILGGSPA